MLSIIVPTDFSDNAYNALFYASRLFTNETCKIVLVHSYHKGSSKVLNRLDTSENEAVIKKIRATVYNQLEEVKHKIKRDSEGLDLEVELIYGSLPLHEIMNDLIFNREVNFVVMGTKGSTGWKEVFMGSQAVSVIKSIVPIPLFLIPENSNFKRFKNTVYATDFKKDTDKQNLKVIKRLINANRSRLHIAHIYNNSVILNTIEEPYMHFKKELQDIEYTTHWIASEKQMEEDLTQFCKEHDMNLLILMYHKYSFLQRILKTSRVEKISFHSDIPLLILPECV
jgi:nucleotide-binding universal stress UspA family protein